MKRKMKLSSRRYWRPIVPFLVYSHITTSTRLDHHSKSFTNLSRQPERQLVTASQLTRKRPKSKPCPCSKIAPIGNRSKKVASNSLSLTSPISLAPRPIISGLVDLGLLCLIACIMPISRRVIDGFIRLSKHQTHWTNLITFRLKDTHPLSLLLSRSREATLKMMAS